MSEAVSQELYSGYLYESLYDQFPMTAMATHRQISYRENVSESSYAGYM